MYQLLNSDIFGSLFYIHKAYFITFNIISHKFLEVIIFNLQICFIGHVYFQIEKKKSQRKKMQEMLKVLPHFATRPGCYFFLPVLLMAWSFYTFGYGAILPPLYKTNVSSRQCFNFLKGRCSLTEKKNNPQVSL